MPKYLYIAILMLVSPACGVSSAGTRLVNPTSLPTVESGVEMVVTGDWYIRTAAGETNPLVDGKNTLHDGEIVTCTEFLVVDDGLWCKHEKGWSNARWMVGYNKVKGE